MKVSFFMIAFLLLPSGIAIAQQLSGVISDKETGELLARAAVYNRNNQLTTYTDEKGYFFLDARRGDTLLISLLGYRSRIVVLSFFEGGQSRRLTLEKAPLAIDTVVISGLSRHQRDSLENRRIFGKKVEEQSPRFKFNRPHPLYGGKSSFNAPLSSWMGRKKKKRLKAFQDRFKADETEKFALSRYDPELVQELTGFTGDTLTRFMAAYPVAPDFVRAATEMEIRMWIRYNYRQWGDKRKGENARIGDTLK